MEYSSTGRQDLYDDNMMDNPLSKSTSRISVMEFSSNESMVTMFEREISLYCRNNWA